MTDTQPTNRDLKGLRDSKGKPLDRTHMYQLGKGTKYWKVKRANGDGTVELASVLPGLSLHRRTAADPARLTAITPGHERLAYAPRTTQTRRYPDYSSVLGPLPQLEDAACAGYWDIFDHRTDGNYRQAAAICNTCPVFQRCRDWSQNTRDELSGYVAGTEHTPASNKARRARLTRQKKKQR